jgi:hypothetical protein
MGDWSSNSQNILFAGMGDWSPNSQTSGAMRFVY